MNPQPNFNLKREIRNQKHLNPIANFSAPFYESDAVDFNEVAAAFPPLLAAVVAFFCVAFFLLASDCKKRKNTGWERETNSEKREKKKSNKEVRGERKMNKKNRDNYSKPT